MPRRCVLAATEERIPPFPVCRGDGKGLWAKRANPKATTARCRPSLPPMGASNDLDAMSSDTARESSRGHEHDNFAESQPHCLHAGSRNSTGTLRSNLAGSTDLTDSVNVNRTSTERVHPASAKQSCSREISRASCYGSTLPARAWMKRTFTPWPRSINQGKMLAGKSPCELSCEWPYAAKLAESSMKMVRFRL